MGDVFLAIIKKTYRGGGIARGEEKMEGDQRSLADGGKRKLN